MDEEEDILESKANIRSQYAIDSQDGDGSVCYPDYPLKEHYCRPAQSDADLTDCVNSDGWTMDFLTARRICLPELPGSRELPYPIRFTS
jgi:hypothetical protein